nr:type II toxin-antitoxin system PemK/MazF family toxin [Neorhizobium galegae]
MITVAISSDFGKPRPAAIIQADPFDETGTVTVLLMSGTLVNAPLLRPTVNPTPANGLRKPSQVMIDKVMSVQRSRLGPVFGRLDDETMLAITRSLAVFLGIG